MKDLIAKEQRARAVANIISGCSVVLFAILLYRVDSILGFFSRMVSAMLPFSIGFVVAFLLNPPMMSLERLLQKADARFFKKRTPPALLHRIVAAVIMYAALAGFVIGSLSYVLPQVIGSIRGLIMSVTRWLNLHQQDIEEFLKGFNWTSGGSTTNLFNSLIGYWDEFAARSLSYTGQLLKSIVNVSTSVGNVVSQMFIGLVISIYMLFGKEKFAAQAKKLGCAFMPTRRVEALTFWFRKTHRVFSGYVLGKILGSLILGIMCYAVMLALRIDYALLISVIVAVTNIVPVFGPIVGGIAGAVILLVVSPDYFNAIKFVISILILQQIEGNVITPRIMGGSIGISSFWIIAAITIGGGLFGLPGILLGIPLFAVVYAIAQTLIAEKLKREGMPPETSAYYDVDTLPERKTPLEREASSGADGSGDG